MFFERESGKSEIERERRKKKIMQSDQVTSTAVIQTFLESKNNENINALMRTTYETESSLNRFWNKIKAVKMRLLNEFGFYSQI